jgi:hypothetical protein
MGTRHLILVYYKGAYHIAQYGQWDGYPEGQGVKILAFIRKPEKVEKLKAAIDGNLLYAPSEKERDEWDNKMREIEDSRYDLWRKGGIVNWRVAPSFLVCPSVSRETGADILEMVAKATEPIPIVKSLDFIADGSFCEWAYVVDLDKATFEVFASLDESFKVENDRFANLDSVKRSKANPQCSGLWFFNALPTEKEFLNHFAKKEDDFE